MNFGLTSAGFKLKRLDDILTEVRASFRTKFGENFDQSDATVAGQMNAIYADREAKLWEALQAVYYSKYRKTAEGVSLDDVLALTGSSRRGASYSTVKSGVGRGDNGTVILKDTIISVQNNPTAKFRVLGDTIINIPDGGTYKSGPVSLQAVSTGPIVANAGTLTVIDTPVVGMASFTNELDAEIGSLIETDAQAKQRADAELQLAGSATKEAIKSELSARPLVQKVIVFENRYSIYDMDGRPPHSLDIVILGDDEDDLADAIFKVIGAGIETIGDIEKTIIDSDGFAQLIKFSRPDEVAIYVEVDLVTNADFPEDGLDQVEALILAYGNTQQGVGQNIIVFGSNGLGGSFDSVPGIIDFNIRIGKNPDPTTDDNVVIATREIAKFDSSRIVAQEV